ncbi:hypothetical protein D5086_026315 [Populus alba]|uniref:Uncharacterized protein n=1 Tax=Populus alba TaxID=43335 RepID=A0ACC4B1L2_POPAL
MEIGEDENRILLKLPRTSKIHELGPCSATGNVDPVPDGEVCAGECKRVPDGDDMHGVPEQQQQIGRVDANIWQSYAELSPQTHE